MKCKALSAAPATRRLARDEGVTIGTLSSNLIYFISSSVELTQENTILHKCSTCLLALSATCTKV